MSWHHDNCFQMARPRPWNIGACQQMATCRMSRPLQFFARAKIVAGPQQSNLEFSSRRKSPSEREKGQRALTITPTGDAAFPRILCCRHYSSVSEEITDLQGLRVSAHTIQGTASPNCPHVRTILVAPREFRSAAKCLCAKTFARTGRVVVSEPHSRPATPGLLLIRINHWMADPNVLAPRHFHKDGPVRRALTGRVEFSLRKELVMSA